jgi:hypothetical protein
MGHCAGGAIDGETCGELRNMIVFNCRNTPKQRSEKYENKYMAKKIFTLKELSSKLPKDEMTAFPDKMDLDDIVGKKITILDAEDVQGEYGVFYGFTFKLGKETYSAATASAGIVKYLKLGKFPFEAVVIKTKSKKRKNAWYYSFKQ